jgi:hypothetical protein
MVVGEALTWISCGKWWISNGYVVTSFGALAEIEEDMGS